MDAKSKNFPPAAGRRCDATLHNLFVTSRFRTSNPKNFRLRRALKTSFSAFSDTFTDAFFCFNFFGDEHFYLSILVDCIVHRLVYFCSRLACKFSFLRLQERAYAIHKTIKISCMRGSECFTGTGACFYYSQKQLKHHARAVVGVLRVQERAPTICKKY